MKYKLITLVLALSLPVVSTGGMLDIVVGYTHSHSPIEVKQDNRSRNRGTTVTIAPSYATYLYDESCATGHIPIIDDESDAANGIISILTRPKTDYAYDHSEERNDCTRSYSPVLPFVVQ